MSIAGTNTTLRNNILYAGGAGRAIAWWASSAPLVSDYNILAADGAGWVSPFGPTLAQFRAYSGTDSHSLSQPPLFVDGAGGDLHLKSTAGSYHSGAWTADALTLFRSHLHPTGSRYEPLAHVPLAGVSG